MHDRMCKGEIRDSTIRDLIEKVRKQSYGSYLVSVRLERIRLFRGAQVNFDFPVTALIGPNGSGKSTILGACACICASIAPQDIFRKSRVGDESMDDWIVEYEVIDRDVNPKGTIRAEVTLKGNQWSRSHAFPRCVRIFSINRTVPATENPLFAFKKKLSMSGLPEPISISTEEVGNIDHIKREAERILGRSLADFQLLEITFTTTKKFVQRRVTRMEVLEDGREVLVRRTIDPIERVKTYSQKQLMYLGKIGESCYSEFSFGSGEASVIRTVADIESQPDGSLVLIEEIENGLHPLAVRRMVEYLIDVAKRKSIQAIFTTHSDYALAPLPSEAIWASVDGRLQQGKLSVEVLRAVSGRLDKRLAIFVEDDFAKTWIEAIVREKLGENLEEIGIYPAYGNGNAVKTHIGHTLNPSISFRSLCFIDGDSRQKEDNENWVFRLPGSMPESTIFDSVLSNLDSNIALLTVACQRPLDKQGTVAEAIREVSRTNRDSHLLFSQLGMRLGFVPEATTRGAFLAIWMQENPSEVGRIAEVIKEALELPPK